MKHNIMVKFRRDFVLSDEVLADIASIFRDTEKTEGIFSSEVHKNVVDRENRYDIIIVIEMLPSALVEYDESAPHLKWKEKYSSVIEKKAIIDY